MENLLNDVLYRIKPTPDEDRMMQGIADSVMEKLKNNLSGIDAEPVIVGSFAKKTHLKNTDIDIFIRYSKEYEKNFIEKNTLEIGKRVLERYELKYAEHPYVHGYVSGVEFDIVPCYRMDEPGKILTAVDRTPFHTEYVTKNLMENQRDQVRLLKQFAKGIGIYGAESRVNGLSGYLVELLIIKYGDFIKVLKNVSNWKKKTVLYLDRKPVIDYDSPLIFIDPVDERRNVSSALNRENYALFIVASKQFLNNPNMKFFFPKDPDGDVKKILDERKSNIIHIIIKKPDVVDDILYTQINKFSNAIFEILRDFIPLRKRYYVDDENIHLLIEMMLIELPETEKHRGPPVFDGNSDKFIEKWRNVALSGPYIEGMNIYADIKRKFTNPKDLIEIYMKHHSVGKDIDRLKDTLRVEYDVENADKMELLKFLLNRFPWEY
ncbi:MAG: CCA tRNA nucleotidyltransferase [Thermoplasmata archaeon]